MQTRSISQLPAAPDCVNRAISRVAGTATDSSTLFFVVDRQSKRRFLIDTGAEVSAIPATAEHRRASKCVQSLQAVNGSSIATYGQRSLTLNLGLRRTFRWVFIVAAIEYAILGADFLRHFGLLVDMRTSTLRDATTNLAVHAIARCTHMMSPTLSLSLNRGEWQDMLKEYPNITAPLCTERPIKHSVTHHIQTSGPPYQLDRAR